MTVHLTDARNVWNSARAELVDRELQRWEADIRNQKVIAGQIEDENERELALAGIAVEARKITRRQVRKRVQRRLGERPTR